VAWICSPPSRVSVWVPENRVILCDLGILADQAAEPVPTKNPGICAWQMDADARQAGSCAVPSAAGHLAVVTKTPRRCGRDARAMRCPGTMTNIVGAGDREVLMRHPDRTERMLKMLVMTDSPAVTAETDAESGSLEFGTVLPDLSAESLTTLRTLSGSALSLAIQRILEEGKTAAVVSAGFNAHF
jgi:hypothetical protein